MPSRIPSLALVGVETTSTAIELVLSRPAPGSAGEVEALDRMVRTFVAVGFAGGFSGPKADAAQSTLVLESGPKPVLNSLSYSLKAAHVDPRAFQLLRCIAVKLGGEGVDVKEILVREVGRVNSARVEVPVPTEETEDSLYPAVTTQCPFDSVFVPIPFTKLRRCLVEFRQALSPDQVRKAAAAVKPWMEVLRAGGFCLPLMDPEEAECIPGVTVQFDEVTLEITMARFQASEAAWRVLMNILCAGAGTLPAFAKVTVE